MIGNLEAARSQFVARIEAVDDPPPGFSTDLGPDFDDIAYAVVPPLSPLDVALVTDGTNLFLDAALLTLGEHVRLTAGEGSEDELAEADLVIYDMGPETLPEELVETNVLNLRPVAPRGVARADRQAQGSGPAVPHRAGPEASAAAVRRVQGRQCGARDVAGDGAW